MKTKNFDTYLESRLSKQKIKQIERDAKMEYETMLALKEDIASAINNYMKSIKLGFNDVVERLGKSPSQVSRIIKGEGNLTLSTIAPIYAFMGKRAHLVAQQTCIIEISKGDLKKIKKQGWMQMDIKNGTEKDNP